MKSKEFYNADHAIRYLNDSIITLMGKPIYIASVGAGGKGAYKLKFFDLSGEYDYQYVMSNSPDIDMTPVPLGMASALDNHITDTSYFVRIPARMWKIGLCSHNLKIYPLGKRALGYNNRTIITGKAMYNTILGKYHTPDDAFKRKSITGISRRFALATERLYYKNTETPVGEYKGGRFSLYEDYTYLQQVLEEDHG